MNEQAPILPQDDQAQIDLEAAQKAKAYLEDGVDWGEEYVGDNQAKVNVFEEETMYFPIGEEAKESVGDINAAYDELRETRKDLETQLVRVRDADDAKYFAQRAARNAGDEAFESSEANASLENFSQERMKEHEALLDKKKSVEDKRDAALWRGRQRYQVNQAGYQINAIQDATAAGHEVKFGGHTFPAGEPVNPDHYEQKIQALQQEQQLAQGEQPVEPQEPQLK